MIKPDGKVEILSFKKVSTGVYRTSFDFKEQSENYRMTYSLFSFTSGTTIDDEVPFITTGAKTSSQKLTDTTFSILLWGSIGLIVILAIIIVIMILRRKGKRR